MILLPKNTVGPCCRPCTSSIDLGPSSRTFSVSDVGMYLFPTSLFLYTMAMTCITVGRRAHCVLSA